MSETNVTGGAPTTAGAKPATSEGEVEEKGRGGDGGAGDEATGAAQYALPAQEPFAQVEPPASYWTYRGCRPLRSVTVREVRKQFERQVGDVPRYPSPGSAAERGELEEVRQLQSEAHSGAAFDRRYRATGRLSAFLDDPIYVDPFPPGAVLNERPRRLPIVRTGAELATLFEAETPGLWHRHVLNVILDRPNPDRPGSAVPLRVELSPPRQALIWHALDLAIDGALAAIWHYKWLATGLTRVARRRRPWEADRQPILYDFRVERAAADDPAQDVVRGDIRRVTPKPTPNDAPAGTPPEGPYPSPGTPRHPAYGSGHSTYSAAASAVLACLLPRAYARDFDLLAENIGEARIIGGVHWRTDHTFGRDVGKAVGAAVIDQLRRSGIVFDGSDAVLDPPPRAALQAAADRFEDSCGEADNPVCTPAATPGTRLNFQGQAG